MFKVIADVVYPFSNLEDAERRAIHSSKTFNNQAIVSDAKGNFTYFIKGIKVGNWNDVREYNKKLYRS